MPKKTGPQPTAPAEKPEADAVDLGGAEKPEEKKPTKAEIEAGKKENKPTGTVKKLEKKDKPKHSYVFTTRLKHDGEVYENGTACEVTGELLALFIKNGYVGIDKD
jgi:hypothetical protein